MLPSRCFFAVEAKREAFRAAAGFYEFMKRRRNRLISARRKCRLQPIAAGIGDHTPADHDGVARESFSLRLLNFNQLLNMLANRALAIFVERRRIPDRLSNGQRAEARVEMVVAGIDQLDGNHAATDQRADLLVSLRIR
jgi:hypothetical protein